MELNEKFSIPRLNFPHNLIDLIAQIDLAVLPRQLGKTPTLRQQTALR